MTNQEKFNEVFGFHPADKREVCPKWLTCEGLENCKSCPFNKEWWDREYKECFELREDL